MGGVLSRWPVMEKYCNSSKPNCDSSSLPKESLIPAYWVPCRVIPRAGGNCRDHTFAWRRQRCRRPLDFNILFLLWATTGSFPMATQRHTCWAGPGKYLTIAGTRSSLSAGMASFLSRTPWEAWLPGVLPRNIQNWCKGWFMGSSPPSEPPLHTDGFGLGGRTRRVHGHSASGDFRSFLFLRMQPDPWNFYLISGMARVGCKRSRPMTKCYSLCPTRVGGKLIRTNKFTRSPRHGGD